jgi:tetratricopeptide (TPR) repeat protein
VQSEEHFRDGISALENGRPGEAVQHFRYAIASERKKSSARPPMRYVSYYGLSLVLSRQAVHQGVEFCERAAVRDSFDAVLLLNLGRVYRVTGRTTKALAAFERGLKLDPTNLRLKIERSRLDRRARPALPGLGRDHPLNRSLGRLRASLLPRRSVREP